MRNKMTLLIILISIILLTYLAVFGVKIGNVEILSISQLENKNHDLELAILEASELTTKSYTQNLKMLEETYERYEIQKQKYEQFVDITNKNDEIYETKQYDIGYLWRVLGSYATKRNVNLGIQVKKNNNGMHNIEFYVKGKYTNISQFITDIENDSDLYFRIYNFNLEGSGEIITASFVVINVNLDASSVAAEVKVDNSTNF